MFGIGTQEILVVLLVVLLLFGGRRLPELARGLGKGLGDFRRAVRDVQREVDLEILKDASPHDPANTRRGTRSDRAKAAPPAGPTSPGEDEPK